MTRYDGLVDGLEPIDKRDWTPPEPVALQPPAQPREPRPPPAPWEREPDCEVCGNGPMAGSGCPLHDPFTILIIFCSSALGLVFVIGFVGTLLGY